MKALLHIGVWLSFVAGLLLTSGIAVAQGVPIGHIIIASSEAKALHAGERDRLLKRRSPIYQGDTIISGEGGKVQIRFQDGTMMTLGSDTVFRVDNYQMQARGDEVDAVTTSLLKGGLRSVTGSISKNSPESFKVNTDVATIGIRGTHFNIDHIRDGLFFGAAKDNIEACNENGCLPVGEQFETKYGFIDHNRQLHRVPDEKAAQIIVSEHANGGAAERVILAALAAAAAEAGGGVEGSGNITPPPEGVVVGGGFTPPGVSGTKVYNSTVTASGFGADGLKSLNLASIKWADNNGDGGLVVNFDTASVGLSGQPTFTVNANPIIGPNYTASFTVTGSTSSLVVNQDFGIAVSGKYSDGNRNFTGTIHSPIGGNTPTFNADATQVNTKFQFIGLGLGLTGSATVAE